MKSQHAEASRWRRLMTLAAAGIAVFVQGAVAQDAAATEPAPAEGAPAETAPAEAAVSAEPAPTGPRSISGSAPQPDPRLDLVAYPVGVLTLTYNDPHPDLPPVESLSNVAVFLTPTPQGWIAAPLPDQAVFGEWPVQRLTIAELSAMPGKVMWNSAITSVIEAVVAELRARSLLGVYAYVDEAQIATDGSGEDLRAGADGLSILVQTTRVSAVRSIAFGDRKIEPALDAKEHARIRLHSPLQPWQGDPTDQAAGRRDLLEEKPLNDYALRMSRFPPGQRRVDVALAQGGEGFGTAEVHYLVREDKTLSGYYQFSNTGTEQTDPWRHRFGVNVDQVTGLDDRLNVEYITSGFDEAHAVQAFYDTGVFGSDTLRAQFGGGWNVFDASEVGAADEQFTGESWFWSAELSLNLAQVDRLFIDLFGGVRYQNIQIENVGLIDGLGEEAVFVPRAGVRWDRRGEAVTWSGSAFFEWSENDVTSADREDLERLGRLNPDQEWLTFQFRNDLSFYLEPLANPDAYRAGTNENWRFSTRAHEIYFAIRGQYAFNQRLIPNYQQVVGGLFSARGYPESIVAGDSFIAGTAEYRWHIPRSFAPGAPSTVFGRPFRFRPERVFGAPDWDLVLKGFVDYGRTFISRPLTIERDEALLSAGFGTEVSVGRNLIIRTEWGYVIEEVATGTDSVVTPGSQRFHILLTVLF